jgi:hypothetical protein
MAYKLIAQAANIYNEQREEPTASYRWTGSSSRPRENLLIILQESVEHVYLEFSTENPLKDHNMSQPGWI